MLLALHPQALRVLGRRRKERTVLVSATNGKTTLTAMLATIAARAGARLVHNMTGANLRSGIATTLLTAPRSADLALLETDEATLPSVAVALGADVIVLGNLFRDQLDRYGELETIADRWRDMLLQLDPQRTVVVFNADDPLIADLVDDWATRVEQQGEHPRPRTVAYGCDDPTVAAARLPHAADSTFCRRCHAPLTYAHSYIGHVGDYRCETCGFARPALDVRATAVRLDGLAASEVVVETTGGGGWRAKVRIPGLYNVYNALGAGAAAHALGIDDQAIADGLLAFSPAFGRFERIPLPDGGTLTLLLVKNPTGLNEVVRTLVDAGVDLTATLFALNDGIADGRDTSWIWDADVEPLLDAAPGLIVTGDRAAEFALRAVYGGADAAGITVEPDVETALFELLDRARTFTEHRHAYALVTYTSMLRMRQVIAEQGWVGAYWKGEQKRGSWRRRRRTGAPPPPAATGTQV